MEFQQEVQTRRKVNFSITEQGAVNVSAEDLDEFELTELVSALNKALDHQQQHQKAQQKIKQFTVSSEIFMHAVAIGFLSLAAVGIVFIIGQAVSEASNTKVSYLGEQNARENHI